MAHYLLRVIWRNNLTNESRDRLVWSWNVESPSAPSASDLITRFNTSFDAIGMVGVLQDTFTTDVAQVYNVDVGGPPIDEVLFGADERTPTGSPGPQEVNLVVSRWVLDGLGRPFKKGRQYIGPIAGGRINQARPAISTYTACLDFAVDFHDQLELGAMSPVVDTKGALHVPLEIVQYSVDNAWDTQRRRGIDPDLEVVKVPAQV